MEVDKQQKQNTKPVLDISTPSDSKLRKKIQQLENLIYLYFLSWQLFLVVVVQVLFEDDVCVFMCVNKHGAASTSCRLL